MVSRLKIHLARKLEAPCKFRTFFFSRENNEVLRLPAVEMRAIYRETLKERNFYPETFFLKKFLCFSNSDIII